MKKEFLNELHTAVQKNSQLKNGTFYKLVQMSLFKNHNQYAEGTFVAQTDGTYDWIQTQFLGSENRYSKLLSLGDQQFSLNKLNQAKAVQQWKKLDDANISLKVLIGPLFESVLQEDFIAGAEKITGEHVRYNVELSDGYFEFLRGEAIGELERAIEDMGTAEENVEFKQAAADQIQIIRERTYSDSLLTVIFDPAGHLVEYKENYSVVDQAIDGDKVEMCFIYRLTDYNLTEADDLLPTVD